jgi:hypothetical protein
LLLPAERAGVNASVCLLSVTFIHVHQLWQRWAAGLFINLAVSFLAPEAMSQCDIPWVPAGMPVDCLGSSKAPQLRMAVDGGSCGHELLIMQPCPAASAEMLLAQLLIA